MVKTGAKTIIRNLQREDVDKMIAWGTHEDPVFYHYNFPCMTKRERDLWYRIKAKDFKKRCFAIENLNNRLIGYISLRDIKLFKRESELGIVFDPDYINKGYGTDALTNFLDLYFNNLKMKSLLLRVGKFNKRAISCYEKCGFTLVGESFHDFEDQPSDESTKNSIIDRYKEIVFIKNKLMTNYYYMKITKTEYIIHRNKLEMLITM